MLGITDIWTYVLGVVFVVLLPGPNSLFVLAVAAQRGVRSGYAAAFGVFLGDAMLMTITALGAATLLHAAPLLFVAVKSLGAAYLGWLGLQLILSAGRLWSAQRPVSGPSKANVAQPLLKALTISLLNPKAILFFLSFFVQFVDPAYDHPGLSFLLLGAIGQAFSALYLSTLIFAGARLASAFSARRRLAGTLSAGVGILFLGFGLKLATATLV
jgi:leucine efflux protein